MNIPIQNVYYLLCYAWNKMQEKDIVNVDTSTYDQLPDLLAKVLLTGCNRLFKQGLDRSYIESTELYPGIKGKTRLQQLYQSASVLVWKKYLLF
jgi:5-methylcytosine-specific restriction enzyme subunit McrC